MAKLARYDGHITTEVNMFRKVALLSLATVMVAGSLTAIPANAATKVSNGVACKKSGASTKSGGTTYRCARNPLVKNAKLTWLSSDCVSLAAAYNRSKAALPAAKVKTDASLAELDVEIAKWKVEAEKAALDIIDYQSKIAIIKGALDKLKADTANATVNRLKISQFELAIRNYESAIKSKSVVTRNLTRFEANKKLVAGTYTNVVGEVGTAKEMAELICLRGN